MTGDSHISVIGKNVHLALWAQRKGLVSDSRHRFNKTTKIISELLLGQLKFLNVRIYIANYFGH
jgi:hypothetical protein